jgi:hypothetical protein
MFEILENLNVLPSLINSEKDNSEITIFKISLNKNIRFKTHNIKLKEYFKSLSSLYLNIRTFYSLNNCNNSFKCVFCKFMAIKLQQIVLISL